MKRLAIVFLLAFLPGLAFAGDMVTPAQGFAVTSPALDALLGATPGGVAVRGANGWVNTGSGVSGQALTSQGAGVAPIWSSITAPTSSGWDVVLGNKATTSGHNPQITTGDLLQFGGATASFTALKPNGTTIALRLADDSAAASLSFGPSTLTAAGQVALGASNGVAWSGRSLIQSLADGDVLLTNNAVNAFGKLQLGGTSNLFPAVKRNSAALNFRLADDSADASITAGDGTFTGSGTNQKTFLSTPTASSLLPAGIGGSICLGRPSDAGITFFWAATPNGASAQECGIYGQGGTPGAAAASRLRLGGDGGTAIYSGQSLANFFGNARGNAGWLFSSDGNTLALNSAGVVGWSSSADAGGTVGTTISRNDAGVLQFGTSTANILGGIALNSIAIGGATANGSNGGTMIIGPATAVAFGYYDLVVNNGGAGNFAVTTYGNGAPRYDGRHASGTLASPGAVQSGDVLLSLSAFGHNSSAFVGSKAAVQAVAAETWTASNNGTGVYFYVTKKTTSTQINPWAVTSEGVLSGGSGRLFGFSSTAASDGAPDTQAGREAAGVWSFAKDAVGGAVAARFYATTDSIVGAPTNADWLEITTVAGGAKTISTNKAGTGTAGSLILATGGTTALTIDSSQGTTVANAFTLTNGQTGGKGIFFASAGPQLYASGSTIVARNNADSSYTGFQCAAFNATTGTFSNTITVTGGNNILTNGQIGFSGSTQLKASADGLLQMFNAAGTGFTSLELGALTPTGTDTAAQTPVILVGAGTGAGANGTLRLQAAPAISGGGSSSAVNAQTTLGTFAAVQNNLASAAFSNGAIATLGNVTFTDGGTGSTGNYCGLLVSPTVNWTGTGAKVFTGLVVNQTQTSVTGATATNLMDLQLAGTSKWLSDSTGAVVAKGTSATPMYSFGGTSASFPALRYSGATLQVVKADNSAFTDMTMHSLTLTSGGTIDIAGKMQSYNSINTAGWGVPAIYGIDFRQGRTTVDGAATTLYTAVNGTSVFRITADIFATAFTSGTATYTITWTQNSSTQTMVVSSAALNVLGTATDLINPDNGTAITAQLTGTFVQTVTVTGLVEQLK